MKLSLIKLVEWYQRLISPMLGTRCRFYPSCSHYAVGCLEKYGASTALLKIAGRLLRCQPWHKGGFDYP